MDNIDDFMRQKFDSDKPAERFEFREEYWEQAQALIEADEARRRKRRRWLFWWFFAGLGLLGALWCLWPDSRKDLPQIGQSSEVIKEQREAETKTKDETSTEILVDSIDNEPVAQIIISSSEEKNPGESRHADQTNSNPDPAGVNEKSAPVASGKGTSPDKRQNSKNTQNRSNTLSDNKNRSTQGNIKPGVSNKEGMEKEDVTTKKAPLETVSGKVEAKQIDASGNAKAADNPTIPVDSVETKSNQLPGLFDLFDPLPLPFKPVLHQKKLKSPVKTSDKDQVNRIDVHKDKRLHWSATVAPTFYSGYTEAEHWGVNAGLAANYQLNPSWMVSLGADWRYIPDQKSLDVADPDASTTQLRYSFGFEEDKYTLESSALHVLELPLSVHWGKRALSLEAGLAPGFLLGVQGRVIKESSSSFNPEADRSVVQKRVSVSDEAYQKSFLSVFAGADWKATNRLSLFTKCGYRTSRVLKEIPDMDVQQKKLLWIDAGLRVRF